MSKKTVRIKIEHKHPKKFINLLEGVVTRHEELGNASPLKDNGMIDMDDFKAKLEQALELRNESLRLRALAESKMNQARVILGTHTGLTINSPGTLYYLVNLVKRYLLVRFAGVEEELTPFGFNVVIGTASGIGRKRKPKP